jgi:hypothetical protein
VLEQTGEESKVQRSNSIAYKNLEFIEECKKNKICERAQSFHSWSVIRRCLNRSFEGTDEDSMGHIVKPV